MTSVKRAGWFAASFLIGGVVGSTIALLYAPESGKNLRKDIRKKTNEIIEDGKKIASDTWNDVKDTSESVVENANDLLVSSLENIMSKTGRVKDALKSGFNAYNEDTRHENKKSNTSASGEKIADKEKT